MQDQDHYVYVFVNEQLSWPQRCVQTAHASIEAAKAFRFECLPAHPYLVLLSAKNLQKLENVRTHLEKLGIRYSCFYEEDRNGELTAIATEPIPEESTLRMSLRKYQLLKEREVLSQVA